MHLRQFKMSEANEESLLQSLGDVQEPQSAEREALPSEHLGEENGIEMK